jgi:hypothetical protein
MARRVIDLDDVPTTISPLEPPSAGRRHTAILTVTITDETTGRAPRAPLWAYLSRPLPSASIRAVDAGVVGIEGKAAEAFSPTLAVSQTISLDIGAPRFTTRHLDVTLQSSLRSLTGPSGAVLSLDSAAGLTLGMGLLLSTSDSTGVELATISATGPGPNQVTLADAPTITFPAGSAVQPLPADQALALDPEPVTIKGCVLKRSGANITTLANALVRLSKLWIQVPPAGSTVQPEPPTPGVFPPPPWDPPIGAVWPPMYMDFPKGSSIEFENRPVDGAMPPKTILDDAPQGTTQLRFSDASGLALGDVVAIDADDDGRREIVEVTNIALTGAVTDWARITINNPLQLLHRNNAIVRRLQAVAPLLTRVLNYDAASGDGVLLFDTTAVTGSHQVRLVDGTRHAFHRVSVYSATSDTQGYYRLPPITRAGKIELAAKDSGSAAHVEVEIVPADPRTNNKIPNASGPRRPNRSVTGP